jgi:hypothetical protein
MSAVQGTLRNDDAKPVARFCSDESVDASIRLTINEIIEVPGFAFMSPLIQNSAALKVVSKQILYFPRRRLTKFSFFNVRADNDIRLESLGVTPFHVIHESRCGLERRLVKEIVVIAEGRRPRCKDPDEEQQ